MRFFYSRTFGYLARQMLFMILLCLAGCNKSEMTVTDPGGDVR